jgi:hypothetical protein
MVSTVADLRALQVVSRRSLVVHHPSCAQARRVVRSPLVKIGDDGRYWRGELRPGRCCFPVVPRPDAPADAPGWSNASPA